MRGSAHTLLSTIHLSNGIFHDAKHFRCTCTLHTVKNRRRDTKSHHFRPRFLIELSSWTSNGSNRIPTCCRCETANIFRCGQQHRECRAITFDSVRDKGDARAWTNKNARTSYKHIQNPCCVWCMVCAMCIACCSFHLALAVSHCVQIESTRYTLYQWRNCLWKNLHWNGLGLGLLDNWNMSWLELWMFGISPSHLALLVLFTCCNCMPRIYRVYMYVCLGGSEAELKTKLEFRTIRTSSVFAFGICYFAFPSPLLRLLFVARVVCVFYSCQYSVLCRMYHK